MVKVVVGTNTPESTWHLHRSLAIKRSPFFRAALSGNFVESSKNIVDLPEDDNQAFAVFVQWLYSTLHDNKFNHESFSSDIKMDALVKSYYLAVKLDVDPLAEAVVTKLYKDSQLCEELMPETLQYAWDHSLPEAPLTELLLDTVSYGIMNRQIHILVGQKDIHHGRAREWRDLARRGGDLVVELLSRISADSLGSGVRPLSSYLGTTEPEVEAPGAAAEVPVSKIDTWRINKPVAIQPPAEDSDTPGYL